MDRREFLKTSLAATVTTNLPAKPKSPTGRPNILYVFSDQHRAASLPGEPFNLAHAPNIDAFRRANLSMDNCISNYPLCTPYRGIFMTGKWPAQSGLVHNELPMRVEEFTVTRAFKAAGYRTAYFGKWHLGHDQTFTPAGPRRFGIDDWHIWQKTNDHYHAWTYNPDTGEKIVPEGWSPTNMTDETLAFLHGRAADRAANPAAPPWFAVVSWNPPHPPFDPPAADQEPYSGALRHRPNVIVPSRASYWVHNETLWHKTMQGYLGGITGIDAEFGRLLEGLDKTGFTDNTVVIYTSDHGEMLGSQGLMAKQLPYEESCHVPFAIRYPGVTPKATSSNALLGAIDIYPTLCGLAGIPVPGHCAGTDLSDILRGKKTKGPEVVFLMNGAGAAPVNSAGAPVEGGDTEGSANKPAFRGVRTERYTYAVTAQGRWLLFDNASDPFQMKNLAQEPAHKALMDGFDAQVRNWLKTSGDSFPYPSSL